VRADPTVPPSGSASGSHAVRVRRVTPASEKIAPNDLDVVLERLLHLGLRELSLALGLGWRDVPALVLRLGERIVLRSRVTREPARRHVVVDLPQLLRCRGIGFRGFSELRDALREIVGIALQ